MKRIVLLFALAAFSTLNSQLSTAQGLRYAGFSGGMMLHTGWIGGGELTVTNAAGQSFHSRLSGPPTGIGGVARIHLGKHLRVGSEGYVSTLNYGAGIGKNRNQSHARIGWGGVLADGIWEFGKWAPYAGLTLGGGGFRNLTLQKPTPPDNTTEIDASFRKYTFLMAAPFAGVEYVLTDKIRLNGKVDWMINLTNRREDFATGPRVYIGFSFYRMK